MRDRIASVRAKIAAADPRLAYIADQYGMFSMLPLDRAQVQALRDDHSIYMATAAASTCLAWPTMRSSASSLPLSRR
jgi:aspartate/tyrosine/aromatic aminotransferase